MIWAKSSGTLRGVTYWDGDKDNPPRILAGTSDGHLIALNARDGTLVPGFGNHGQVDLRAGVTEKFPNMPYHMSSPGAIYRNFIITGAQGKEEDPDGPAMDVRAWDLRTGKLVWTFHTIPHPGEPGYETWPKDNWATAGSPANWGAATVDVRSRTDFSADRPACLAILWRRSGRAELVFLFHCGARCQHREGTMAFSDHASRRVGL